jgi:putative transposase
LEGRTLRPYNLDMPAKNAIKPHVADSWYHLYNRGNNKQQIFIDSQDYFFFIRLLKIYLSPELKINPRTGLFRPENLSETVNLSCFCLMPNHYHLLVKQTDKNGITQLTQHVNSTYVMYFNKKYQKVGSLFEGKLKGVLIDSDTYLLHLSRYIHRNPINLLNSDPFDEYPYSSYPYYVGKKHASWIETKSILDYFYSPLTIKQTAQMTYKEFVEYDDNESDVQVEGLILE